MVIRIIIIINFIFIITIIIIIIIIIIGIQNTKKIPHVLSTPDFQCYIHIIIIISVQYNSTFIIIII